MVKLVPNVKIWLETKDRRSVIGKGGIELIKAINEQGSIHKAAKSLNMSYSHAADLINELNDILGVEILEKVRGGIGGGGTKITKEGMNLVKQYEEINSQILDVIKKYGGIKIG